MDWARQFYSVTDRWWGRAESEIDDSDRWRAAVVRDIARPGGTVLELGCGYGTTAASMVHAGFEVTAVDFSDRIERAPDCDATFIRADFMAVEFDRRFDIVCYWDGFGVGSDADQKELLHNIGNKWLAPGGSAVVEVFDPTGWEADNGLTEHNQANPAQGYDFSLGHRRTFDIERSVATDTWWELGADPPVEYSQRLRCYSPAALEELLTPTPLRLDRILEAGRSDWSYLAVLQR